MNCFSSSNYLSVLSARGKYFLKELSVLFFQQDTLYVSMCKLQMSNSHFPRQVIGICAMHFPFIKCVNDMMSLLSQHVDDTPIIHLEYTYQSTVLSKASESSNVNTSILNFNADFFEFYICALATHSKIAFNRRINAMSSHYY